jgi:DNA-binding beta-propeller fold protein YncE
MGNRRVQVFSTDGEFLTAFHRPGVQDWQILGLIVAPDRSIYVADALNNVIWVFDRQGRVQNRIEVRL